MSKTTEVKHSESDVRRYEAIIEKAAKAAKTEVRCWLDRRFTQRESTEEAWGWSAYVRALLKNDHTAYLGLPSEECTVSDKPVTKSFLMKIESKERRAAARATREAERETKKAAPKVAKPKAEKTVKMKTPSGTAEVKVKA